MNQIECKWPAFTMTGPNVTVEQAKDIIKRTDSWVRNLIWGIDFDEKFGKYEFLKHKEIIEGIGL